MDDGWVPGVEPGVVADERFGALWRAARDGVRWDGCVALVSGGGRSGSIGYRVAVNLAMGGARVVLADILPLSELRVQARAVHAEAGDGAVLPVQLDQGDLAAIDALFDRCQAEGLRFTHLFPLAAVHQPKLLIHLRPEDYERIFRVNVYGVYHLVVRHMRALPERRPFHVVLPLSPNDGRLRGSGLYSPSKQAIRALVVQGQNEFGDRRGGCYCGLDIAWTRSSLMRPLDDRLDAARAEGLTIFEPQDTADCLCLLATPAAMALKGTVIDASGGFGRTPPEAFNRIFAPGT